jgi:hypothetical protein
MASRKKAFYLLEHQTVGGLELAMLNENIKRL